MHRATLLKRITDYNIYGDNGWTDRKKLKHYRKFCDSIFATSIPLFDKTQSSFELLCSQSTQYSTEELDSVHWSHFVRAWQTEDYHELDDEFMGYIDTFMSSQATEECITNAGLLDRIVSMSYAIADNERVYNLVKSRRNTNINLSYVLDHALKGINHSRYMCEYIMGEYW